MNISSVPVPSFNSSNDTITLTNTGCVSGGIIAQDVGTVLGGAGSIYSFNTGAGVGGYSIGGAGTISSISATQFNWKTPEEFVDAFPDFDRIKTMCDQYPGLKIAYEKFVTTYRLVKDHYDTPEDQRPLA